MIDPVGRVLLKATGSRRWLQGCRVEVHVNHRQVSVKRRDAGERAEIKQGAVVKVDVVDLHENRLDGCVVPRIGGRGCGRHEIGVDSAVTCEVHCAAIEVSVRAEILVDRLIDDLDQIQVV